MFSEFISLCCHADRAAFIDQQLTRLSCSPDISFLSGAFGSLHNPITADVPCRGKLLSWSVFVCALTHIPLTCVPHALDLIGSQTDKLFILGVDFSPFPIFASLPGLTCCCIWPINNVLLNQRLLCAGVITSSII